MPKSIKIYIFILVLIFIGTVWVDANKQKPIDWKPTYANNDKIPYGLYVFDKEAGGLFKNQKLEKIGATPYEYFEDKYNYEDSTYNVKGTVLYIDNEVEIDNSSLDELFYFASRGNDVFISSTRFENALKDSLKFDIVHSNAFQDTIAFSVTNKNLKPKEYYFDKDFETGYFTFTDSITTEILGHQKAMDQSLKANFIRIPYVNGNFYLHTQPIAFTNYNLLQKDNSQYVAQISSYINQDTVFWFSKFYDKNFGSKSKLDYIFSEPALKSVWYLFILGFIIFMIFNAKRKQRVIPIVEPLRNTTVDFAKTIGNLYYLEGDHKNIIDKKIIFFLEKIRNEYYLDTTTLNEQFIQRLHQKSGINKELVLSTITKINYLRNKQNCTEKELIDLNNALENFKKD